MTSSWLLEENLYFSPKNQLLALSESQPLLWFQYFETENSDSFRKSLSLYLSRDQLSNSHLANCLPELPSNPSLILEIMSPGQVGICSDRPNLIVTLSPN